VARNTAYFRTLNERIVDTAAELGFDGFVPLLCECPDPRCFRLARATLAEFEALRAHPERLVLYPGHEDVGEDRVVAATDRYTLVERGAAR
jgi:hypothetical protein